MGFRATIAWLVVLICGCYSPQLTHCPDVVYPSNEVCDNHGGCAFPQQHTPCVGQADATSCAYTDQTGKPIDGTCQAGLCVPLACGDGVLTSDEVCDDGNNLCADGCSGDCKSIESCGNGIVDALAGEVCDDGNTIGGDGCSADCRSIEVCGNGVVDSGLGEVCDDGNTVSGDGCSSDCKSKEVCGNGIVDTIDEQCDLGGANSDLPDHPSRTTCKQQASGDSNLEPGHGEHCDNGVANSTLPAACRPNCELQRCGDGIQDSCEVCDDGNVVSGDGCSSDCKSKETCGNGIIDLAKGEQCDAGSANSNAPKAPCRLNCKLPA